MAVRSAVGAGSEQPQESLRGDVEAAQAPGASSKPRVSFVAPGAGVSVTQELEDEEDDDRDSVFESQVVDKTYSRLVQYVYDNYDESRPLSDPSAPPCCDFESYFAVAEPHFLTLPQMRIYSRVSELLSQSRGRSVKFARESKPLHKGILLRRRVFPVADEPDFSSPPVAESGLRLDYREQVDR